MQLHRFTRFFILLVLPLLLVVASCQHGNVCAGLNNHTGSANNSKRARQGHRGGYKSPREVEARDHQRKRIRSRQHQSARKSRGGGNTAGGRRGFTEEMPEDSVNVLF